MDRLIVLAFDGLSWNVLNELFQKNKMRNLQKLIKNGASGANVGVPPLISPKIWTSISTGKKGENHGIMDFYSTHDDLKSYQVWDILNKYDYRVGIYRDLSALALKKIDDFYIPSFYSFVEGSFPSKLRV
jgi:predicted AlkP superfamily phosphohydrolase/phosphomutase